jgi:hypothetical protein
VSALIPEKARKEALQKIREVGQHIEIFLRLLKKQTPVYLDLVEGGWTPSLTQEEFEAGLAECFSYSVVHTWTTKENIPENAMVITNDKLFFREGRPLNDRMRDMSYGAEKYGNPDNVWPTNWLAVAILMTRDGLNQVDLRNAILSEYRMNREV